MTFHKARAQLVSWHYIQGAVPQVVVTLDVEHMGSQTVTCPIVKASIPHLSLGTVQAIACMVHLLVALAYYLPMKFVSGMINGTLVLMMVW